MTEWIVTSSALILIVIALRGLLKGKISLKLQYALWALVLVRLLLPFSIVESAISVSNLLATPVIQEADDAVADYESAYEEAVQKYRESETTVSEQDIRLEVQQQLYDRTYQKLEQEYAQTGAVVTETQLQTQAQQQVEVISLTAVITEALPYLWIGGMIAAGAALIGSNLHFAWNLYKSRKPLDILGVPLKVYLTDYVATPCLFGFLLPDIYLTREVMEDSKMRSHVLAHEMSHYRQGDHIWSALRCVCLVLHWYNPLVWVAVVLSKQDAELACDEATIKYLGEAERVEYGRTLIGMTCVRRDPRSLMLTATTMLGTKKTLKERIALIAKKPKTALYTLISCVLVAAIAVGCTFTGAPTEPTEPTSPEDAVWEQLNEAVDAVNSAESRHFSLYLLPEHPGEVDLDGITPAGECWVYGDDFYLVYNTEPSQLYYEGTNYAHISGNSWLVDRAPDDDDYGIDIPLPSRNAYTMTWTQTEEYLDVVLQSNDDENESLLYRMDANRKLLWYAATILGAVTGADGVQTPAVLYAVYVLHDTAPADVREKVETSAAEILSTMVEWDGTPPTESAEAELLDRCRDAVEYIQNLEYFEITEHYESIEESDYVLGPNFVEAIYVHSGDDWYHNRITVDWTWRFLEKDGVQYRKDITGAVPEEDIPAIEWMPQDLSTNLHAKHVWIMDIQWDEDTIEYLTYTGNGDGYEGGSLTPVFVTSATDGDADLIRVEFEIGTERIVNAADSEGVIWIFTFRFDRESGIVTEVKREIVMEDREIHVAGINGGTEYVDFRSTSTLYIYPGTEEEMSSIIDGIYYGEIVTTATPEPTEPTTEPTTESTAPLTVEEQFQQMLISDYWYSRIMGCTFQNPAEISMEYMFYIGLELEERTYSDDFTETEITFLKDRLRDTWWGEDNWVNAHKLPAGRLDDILREYLGVSLSDVTIPDNWMYYPETDAYYVVHTDAYAVGRTVVTRVAEHDDGTIGVYYTIEGYYHDTATGNYLFGDTEMVLTLRQTADGHYQVLSNQVDPDSLSYLLLNHDLGPLFRSGNTVVHIDSKESESARIIDVKPALLYGLVEHLEHYAWSETDFAGSGDFLERMHFRNVGHENYSKELELTVLSDGTYLLRYSSRDDNEVWTTSHWRGTPKSSDFGTAAEDMRAFIDAYWPE